MSKLAPHPLNYLARQTLFELASLRKFLNLNDALPIGRKSIGLAGVKESLKRLKHGEMLVMFPGGTQSANGELLPFKPGFELLARRTRSRLLTIALDGYYQAFPHNAKLPKLGETRVVIGEPIAFDEYRDSPAEDLQSYLEPESPNVWTRLGPRSPETQGIETANYLYSAKRC